MKIAYVGLADSHPFSDADHVTVLRDDVEFHIWDDHVSRVEQFLMNYPAAVVHPSFEQLVAAQPDGALLTMPPSRVAPLTASLLATSCAVAITKPAATNEAELHALHEAVAGAEDRVLTSSILRFAPDLPASDTVTRAHVVAAHNISYWTAPGSRWQDEAGGLIPMMGVHAFELLEALLGPTIAVTDCVAKKTSELALRSPDIAVGSAENARGTTATFTIDGTASGQSYAVQYTDADGEHEVTIGSSGGADPFGSIAMTRHLLAMADSAPSPLAWTETTGVLRCVAEARRLAER